MDIFEQLFNQDQNNGESPGMMGSESSHHVQVSSESGRSEDRSGANMDVGKSSSDHAAAEQTQHGNVIPFEKSSASSVGELSESVSRGTSKEIAPAVEEQRDLFGELIESAAEPKSKTRSTTPKISSSSAIDTARVSKATARGWKDQDIEVGIDFTVHYATRTFLVEDLIDEIPESGKVHLSVIREALFREYWDFSESRTKWDYDLEEKKLCPIIIGEKNNAL